jgi:electron transport complex protein RnfC
MTYTFKGGFHPEGNKNSTEGKSIVEISTPEILIIPLSQHIGAICEPIVTVGDLVFVGQKLADSKAFVSVPIHSSVSGKIIAIEKKPHSVIGECMSIVIENDFKYEIHPDIKPIKDFDKLSSKELIAHIREAGIVGMGGATFPTFIKLSVPEGKKVDTIIINCAECEPYLTADHRIMLERPFDIIDGLKIIMKALNVNKGIIAIEDNKKDAYAVLKNESKGFSEIEVILVKTKYPQGAEKQIIDAVLKREVPSGKLPIDVGVVVQNVATSAEISTYFRTGMPLIKRVLTVSGSGTSEPQNLLVKIGTPFSYIADFVKIKDNIKKVIAGGPMMGITQFSLDVPVIKGTSGILFFTDKEYSEYKTSDCLRCGRCVDNCPLRLMPFMIVGNAKINDFENAEKYGLKDCCECGVCSYVCPSRIKLVQTIKTTKAKLAER